MNIPAIRAGEGGGGRTAILLNLNSHQRYFTADDDIRRYLIITTIDWASLILLIRISFIYGELRIRILALKTVT
jgi:hypothetical protein